MVYIDGLVEQLSPWETAEAQSRKTLCYSHIQVVYEDGYKLRQDTRSLAPCFGSLTLARSEKV